MYTVLVCDDDTAICNSIKIYLAQEGYNVLTASNGREAIDLVENNEIHCLVLDIMMPEVDGITATLKIREKHNIPIIMLSAKSEDTDKIAGLSFGADDYVTKPFNPLELIARVKSQIRRYSSLGSMKITEGQLVTGGLVFDTNLKRVTVDGSAVKEPKNVIAPIGTSVKDIIEFCGGYKSEPKKLILGGPMMGTAIADDSACIKKNTNAVLAFDDRETELMKETACIRCGRCADSCPMKLTPPLIEQQLKLKNTEELKKLGVMDCMECGCCAYSCPAGKHVGQMMRLAKSELRKVK